MAGIEAADDTRFLFDFLRHLRYLSPTGSNEVGFGKVGWNKVLCGLKRRQIVIGRFSECAKIVTSMQLRNHHSNSTLKEVTS